MPESSEERRLRLHLQSAHRLAGIGGWEADFGGPLRLYWSPEVREIAGLAPDQAPSFETFVSLIHPDDRPLFLDVRAAALAGERPYVGSSRVDLQACKLEYSIVSPK